MIELIPEQRADYIHSPHSRSAGGSVYEHASRGSAEPQGPRGTNTNTNPGIARRGDQIVGELTWAQGYHGF